MLSVATMKKFCVNVRYDQSGNMTSASAQLRRRDRLRIMRHERDAEEVDRQRAAHAAHVEDLEEVRPVLLLEDEPADEIAGQHEEHRDRDPAERERVPAVRHLGEEVRHDDHDRHEPAQAVEGDDARLLARAQRSCARRADRSAANARWR